MITVTNDVKDFIENQTGEIFIYGAGNSGYWVGYYLNRCGIEFSGYIDSNEEYCGALCQEKPVYQLKKLSEIKGRSFRLIISPRLYEPILSEFLFKERKYGFNILCLVPRFMNFIANQEVYDINYFLGYFRKRLYKKDTPTIISNDCVAGEIYHLMNMSMLSPTINTGIEPDDFLKICKNPQKYFAMEGKGLFYNIYPLGRETMEGRMFPAMRIEDITVTFSHTHGKTEELIEWWNMMRKRINWGNIIYVFRITDGISPVLRDFMYDFSKVEGKIINYGVNGSIYRNIEQINLPRHAFGTDQAVENFFDLLGWLNLEEGRGKDDR